MLSQGSRRGGKGSYPATAVERKAGREVYTLHRRGTEERGERYRSSTGVYREDHRLEATT
jgi:hypothetical protein